MKHHIPENVQTPAKREPGKAIADTKECKDTKYEDARGLVRPPITRRVEQDGEGDVDQSDDDERHGERTPFANKGNKAQGG